ncbi:hypothetical protein ACFY1B_21950 [Streptomyces mirabilis]|uniref:hypothetical protein n=1 Tax=Streptomyces mirabilis TaxID=68239 RepID=UPI0036C909B9
MLTFASPFTPQLPLTVMAIGNVTVFDVPTVTLPPPLTTVFTTWTSPLLLAGTRRTEGGRTPRTGGSPGVLPLAGHHRHPARPAGGVDPRLGIDILGDGGVFAAVRGD